MLTSPLSRYNQANKPPTKMRKKTVFFVKTVPGKLDAELFKKNVSALTYHIPDISSL